VHAIKTRANRRRATDSDVNFARARFADDANQLAKRGAAHEGVVYQDDAPAFENAAHRVVLEPDTKIPDILLRLDECAPDIMIADQRELERQTGFRGVAN